MTTPKSGSPSSSQRLSEIVAPLASALSQESMTGSELRLTPTCRLRLSDFEQVTVRSEIPRERELVADHIGATIGACCKGRSPWPLYMHGDAGTGKTRAALCLCDRVNSFSWEIIFRDFDELCDEHADAKGRRTILEGTHGETVVTPQMLWTQWEGATLTVLDDVGIRERATDHQFETLKRAIEKRYARPLVVISNLDLRQLAAVFDDRIASRCSEGTILHFTGDDRRIQMKDGVAT